VGGTENVTLQTIQLPQHTHQAMGNSGAGTANTPQSNVWAGSVQGDKCYAAQGDKNMNAGAIGTAGQNQPHNNMQPTLAVMFIIALVGIFPPRN
jgi:microcystin-dependent protein